MHKDVRSSFIYNNGKLDSIKRATIRELKRVPWMEYYAAIKNDKYEDHIATNLKCV